MGSSIVCLGKGICNIFSDTVSPCSYCERNFRTILYVNSGCIIILLIYFYDSVSCTMYQLKLSCCLIDIDGRCFIYQ